MSCVHAEILACYILFPNGIKLFANTKKSFRQDPCLSSFWTHPPSLGIPAPPRAWLTQHGAHGPVPLSTLACAPARHRSLAPGMASRASGRSIRPCDPIAHTSLDPHHQHDCSWRSRAQGRGRRARSLFLTLGLARLGPATDRPLSHGPAPPSLSPSPAQGSGLLRYGAYALDPARSSSRFITRT